MRRFFRGILVFLGVSFMAESSIAYCTQGKRVDILQQYGTLRSYSVNCNLKADLVKDHQFRFTYSGTKFSYEFNRGWESASDHSNPESIRDPYLVNQYPSVKESFDYHSYIPNMDDSHRVFLKTPLGEVTSSNRKVNAHIDETVSGSYDFSSLNLSEIEQDLLFSGEMQFCSEVSGFVGDATLSASWNDANHFAHRTAEIHPDSSDRVYNDNKSGIRKTFSNCKSLTIEATETPILFFSDIEFPATGSLDAFDTNEYLVATWDVEPDTTYRLYETLSITHSPWVEVDVTEPGRAIRSRRGGTTWLYLDACKLGICKSSEISKIRHTPTPELPSVTPMSTTILTNGEVILKWRAKDFYSANGLNSRFILEAAKKPHTETSYSEYETIAEVPRNHDLHYRQSGYSLTYEYPLSIENGYDYKFRIAACSAPCSEYSQFWGIKTVDGYNHKEEMFNVAVPPSEAGLSVLVSEAIELDGIIEPLIGESTNGRYALNLTSINASQFEIREFWVLRNTVVEEVKETSFVPISVDPALIIPVNKYLQNIIETEDHSNSPFLGDTQGLGNRYIVNKSLNQTSQYRNFSKQASGTYYYTVTACDRLWDLTPNAANTGLTKSDHCVTSPQVVVEVNLQIKQPEPGSVKFNQNGTLTADFEDSNLAAPTSFRLYDAQDRLIGVYATILEAQAALEGYQGNLFGVQLIACNTSTCTSAIQIVVPPSSPSFLKVTGSDTGGDFEVEWAASNGADNYELSYEVFDLDDPTRRIYPESGDPITITTTETKWTYVSNDDMKFGRYQFTVKAKNDAGVSGPKGPAIWMVELDPTLYIRKQLYTAWEQDDCQATNEQDCLELGDNVDRDSPEDGEYNRNAAAYRYLDAIYSKDVATNVVRNIAGSSVLGDQLIVDDPLSSDEEITVLYGNDERQKALRAENFARALLSEQPKNSNVRQLILDIYYDRAVAEMLIADSLRTKARVMRFIDESVNTESYDLLAEAELHNRASEIYELALFGEADANNQFKLPGYSNLISPFNSVYQEILVDFSEQRAQVSPRYWDDNKVSVSRLVLPEGNDENGLLLNGYKDLVLIYELMTELLTSKGEALKLTVMAGESNSTIIEELDFELRELRAKMHNLHVSLVGNRKECLNYIQYYRFSEEGLPSYTDERLNEMCRADNHPDDFPFVAGLFGESLDAIEGNQWNGFLSAKSNYLKADEKVDVVRKWLDGDVNIIGLPNNILFRKDTDDHETSFDAYIQEIEEPNSRYRELNNDFLQARADYEAFRANSDRSATEYTNRVAQWQAKLVSLLGYNCSITSCDKTGGYEGSEMSIQVKAIEAAYLDQKLAEEQVEIFDQQLLIEIDRLKSLIGNHEDYIGIILDYGSQQIDIEKRITKLKIDAMKKQRRLGAMTSITNASSAFASGFVAGGSNPYAGAASAGASMANSIADYQAAGVAINSTRNIGKLEQLSAELALEQQVKLMRLTHESEELALAASIESKWLEANTYLINAERAAKNVELEYEKLSYIVEQAEYAFRQIELASEETSERYFADPIHVRRVTNSMIEAEENFGYVQQRLWLAANMLEYKLGVFLSASEVDHGFEKRDVLKARTFDDLKEYLTKMKAYDNKYDVNEDTVVEEISLKNHLLGYEDIFGDGNEFSEIYKNPNPNKVDEYPLLSGIAAFKEHVIYGWELFNDSGKMAEYESWKSSSPYHYEIGTTGGVNLVIALNTNKYIQPLASVQSDVFGRLSIGKNSKTGELCYKDLGNYANFIKKVGVNVDVSLINYSKIKGKVVYAGESRSYKRYVPDLGGRDGNLTVYYDNGNPLYIGTGEDQVQVLFTDDIQYHELLSKISAVSASPYEFDRTAFSYSDMQSYSQYKNAYLGFSDFVEYPARNWYYDNSGELTFDTTIDVVMDMGVRMSPPAIDDIAKWSPYIYSSTKLQELSVFTDGWKIEVPIKGVNGSHYVNPNVLDDIQFYIQYDKTDRNGDSQKCP